MTLRPRAQWTRLNLHTRLLSTTIHTPTSHHHRAFVGAITTERLEGRISAEAYADALQWADQRMCNVRAKYNAARPLYMADWMTGKLDRVTYDSPIETLDRRIAEATT